MSAIFWSSKKISSMSLSLIQSYVAFSFKTSIFDMIFRSLDISFWMTLSWALIRCSKIFDRTLKQENRSSQISNICKQTHKFIKNIFDKWFAICINVFIKMNVRALDLLVQAHVIRSWLKVCEIIRRFIFESIISSRYAFVCSCSSLVYFSFAFAYVVFKLISSSYLIHCLL